MEGRETVGTLPTGSSIRAAAPILLRAIGAQAMTELGIGVLADVRLHGLPFVAVAPDALAARA